MCFCLCCVAMFWCLWFLVQTVGYQKVLTCILNVFGCHCTPLISGAWLVSSSFTYYCQYFVRLLFTQYVGFSFIYLVVLSIVRAEKPIAISRIVTCSVVSWSLLLWNLKCNAVLICVLTNGYLFFCSDEETRQPSPEVVEISPPPHRRGPKQKVGHHHPTRE